MMKFMRRKGQSPETSLKPASSGSLVVRHDSHEAVNLSLETTQKFTGYEQGPKRGLVATIEGAFQALARIGRLQARGTATEFSLKGPAIRTSMTSDGLVQIDHATREGLQLVQLGVNAGFSGYEDDDKGLRIGIFEGSLNGRASRSRGISSTTLEGPSGTTLEQNSACFELRVRM